jgi:acyl carrier protein
VLDVVFAVVKAVLGTDDVDADQPLTAAGMDSLLAVELRNALQREAGVPLPATVGYDYPTARAIAVHLVELLAKKAGAEASDRLEPTKLLSMVGGSDWDKRVAIVGAGCRLPGGANSPEEFWALVHSGGCGVTEFPASRFEWQHLYDPEPGLPNKIYVKRASIINDIEMFDAAFFGITPVEATLMDPQQRLLLEVSYEAIERSGIPHDSANLLSCGTFVGACSFDYSELAFPVPSPFAPTGTFLSALSGRISYCLGLRGPSMIIDTACSSSMVSAAVGFHSILRQECTHALLGGV